MGGVFGALKIGLILSVLLIVFDTMNKSLPFADEDTLNDSELYAPIKALAPTLFPSILNKKSIGEEENDPRNTII